eukprot:14737-Rhodomonas_salina.1
MPPYARTECRAVQVARAFFHACTKLSDDTEDILPQVSAPYSILLSSLDAAMQWQKDPKQCVQVTSIMFAPQTMILVVCAVFSGGFGGQQAVCVPPVRRAVPRVCQCRSEPPNTFSSPYEHHISVIKRHQLLFSRIRTFAPVPTSTAASSFQRGFFWSKQEKPYLVQGAIQPFSPISRRFEQRERADAGSRGEECRKQHVERIAEAPRVRQQQHSKHAPSVSSTIHSERSYVTTAEKEQAGKGAERLVGCGGAGGRQERADAVAVQQDRVRDVRERAEPPCPRCSRKAWQPWLR